MIDTAVATSCIGAVVLAGGRVPAALAAYCAHRATLPIRGHCMPAYVLRMLATSTVVRDFVLVAPAEALPALADLPGRHVAARETLVENMLAGKEALAGTPLTHVLFLTGDIPMLTREGLEGYITDSLLSGAALTYPIIPRALSEARFPGARRTYVRIKEGTFTGGNAIFTTAGLLDDQQTLIQQLYSARKAPLQLAGLLGWGTVLRLLTGTLTLPYLERIATRLLHAPARAIITPYPELGFDVDKPQDLRAVEQALALKDG